ncbi:MAG: DNA gyrase subunit A [Eubacteriales bacterium]|nr:DNA gyrase subunit A [Eubacteriales bacterium]
MADEKNENEINQNTMTFDSIKDVDLKKTMENSFLDYSMSVIVSRALPDVRDGLKPVQRRVLYSLQTLGVTPDAKTKKCATIVGECMGKYHPHGDSSIYGALVNMGQPWSMREVLIDKQGNFGSEDGDSPAAMRYTEAKMSKMAGEMLNGINKNTVDFIPNFSNEYDEPTVLPARFPNLLVNGATGIAVGMATNIPPHNLTEVIEAVVKIIENKINEKETDIQEIMQIIKGPDFPTGAQIIGKRGIQEYLQTGRGKIVMRSTCEIETKENGRNRIIVKELPYMVYRSALIEKIADLVKDKKIDGISSIVDVYGNNKKHERIHIDLKKDANANVVLNQLYKHTELQTSFGVIMLCIVNGEPKVLNVLQMLNEFLNHQINVVTRRTKFDLSKCEDRSHILEGLLKALNIIDEIIKTIKESKDAEEAKINLIKKYEFSEKQSNAIVEMRLKALTNLELNKLKAEYDDLQEKIKNFKEILDNPKKLLNVIKTEILEISNKTGDVRSTEILLDEDSLAEDFVAEDLIPNDNIVVTMTNLGYIKRMISTEFRTQSRGGKGIKGMKTIQDDFITQVFTATNHTELMFISNLGKCYKIKGYQIPEAQRTARGTAIVNLLKLQGGEHIASGTSCEKDDEEQFIIFATKKGIIKRSKLSEYTKSRTTGLKALNIKDDDELVQVKITKGNDDIFIITKKGKCVRFKENVLRAMGRTATGVRGMKVANDDEVIAMITSSEGEYILLVSENGIGKRTSIQEFSAKNRGGKGMICYKPSEKTGILVGAIAVNENDEIMIINEEGIIIKTQVTEHTIRSMGRASTGVKLMQASNSKIASVTKVVETMEEE